jgi:hypothetical protein
LQALVLQSCSKPGPTNTDQILDELAAKYKPEDLPEKQAVLNFINNHRKRKDASLKQGQKRTWRIADFEALVARLPDVTDPGDPDLSVVSARLEENLAIAVTNKSLFRFLSARRLQGGEICFGYL